MINGSWNANFKKLGGGTNLYMNVHNNFIHISQKVKQPNYPSMD